MDLLETFRAALDKYSPRLLKLYHAVKGAFSQHIENLLQKLEQLDLLIKQIYFWNNSMFPENFGIL